MAKLKPELVIIDGKLPIIHYQVANGSICPIFTHVDLEHIKEFFRQRNESFKDSKVPFQIGVTQSDGSILITKWVTADILTPEFIWEFMDERRILLSSAFRLKKLLSKYDSILYYLTDEKRDMKTIMKHLLCKMASNQEFNKICCIQHSDLRECIKLPSTISTERLNTLLGSKPIARIITRWETSNGLFYLL